MKGPRFPGYTLDDRGDEVKAYYGLYGDFDPDDITKLTGVQPTDTRPVGWPQPQTGRRVAQARWLLEPDHEGLSELQDHVGAVLAALGPSFDAFCALGQRYEVYIHCVVYAHGGQAGQIFEREHVRLAGLLNAAFDLDLYALIDLADEDEDEE